MVYFKWVCSYWLYLLIAYKDTTDMFYAQMQNKLILNVNKEKFIFPVQSNLVLINCGKMAEVIASYWFIATGNKVSIVILKMRETLETNSYHFGLWGHFQ